MAFDSDTEADLTLAIVVAAATTTDAVLHQTLNSTLFEYTNQLMQSYCVCVWKQYWTQPLRWHRTSVEENARKWATESMRFVRFQIQIRTELNWIDQTCLLNSMKYMQINRDHKEMMIIIQIESHNNRPAFLWQWLEKSSW